MSKKIFQIEKVSQPEKSFEKLISEKIFHFEKKILKLQMMKYKKFYIPRKFFQRKKSYV